MTKYSDLEPAKPSSTLLVAQGAEIYFSFGTNYSSLISLYYMYIYVCVEHEDTGLWFLWREEGPLCFGDHRHTHTHIHTLSDIHPKRLKLDLEGPGVTLSGDGPGSCEDVSNIQALRNMSMALCI